MDKVLEKLTSSLVAIYDIYVTKKAYIRHLYIYIYIYMYIYITKKTLFLFNNTLEYFNSFVNYTYIYIYIYIYIYKGIFSSTENVCKFQIIVYIDNVYRSVILGALPWPCSFKLVLCIPHLVMHWYIWPVIETFILCTCYF